MRGTFKRGRILANISFGTRNNGTFKLLNEGNTNGAATVHVLVGMFPTGDKGMLISNRRVSCGGISVNCLPRRHKLCPGGLVLSRLVCFTRLENVDGGTSISSVSC